MTGNQFQPVNPFVLLPCRFERTVSRRASLPLRSTLRREEEEEEEEEEETEEAGTRDGRDHWIYYPGAKRSLVWRKFL